MGDSTLGRQTQDFIQSLSTEVARSARTVLVYSLQASTREAYGNAALLGLLDHLTSRVDAKREPVVGDEILPVLRRRLLSGPVPGEPSEAVAEEYATQVTHMRRANASDEVAQRTAEDDRLALRDRFAAAYPVPPGADRHHARAVGLAARLPTHTRRAALPGHLSPRAEAGKPGRPPARPRRHPH